MDEHRFDTLTRSLAHLISRRSGLRLLASAGASLLALARGKGEAAAQEWFLTAGEPCRTDDQCRGADAPLVCADNGIDIDGPLNCCTYEGSRCAADEGCCGTAYCDADGLCSSAFDARGVGNLCQTTEQCRRTQTGAICEYTISTQDSRCCWYQGICTSGAQCCGSRVCAGGVCQFLDDGANRDGGDASGEWCGGSYCEPWQRCCSQCSGICAPRDAVCGEGSCRSGWACPGGCSPAGPCPGGCQSGYCNGDGTCA